MELKFFSGRTPQEAKEEAAEHFGCAEEDLFIEVFRKGDSVSQWIILAVPKWFEVPTNANGRYVVSYEPTGVYLELYPSRGSGQAANGMQMQKYLQRKNVLHMNPKEVRGVIATGGGRAKIAPAQEAVVLDEDVEVFVSPDGLSASITFYPADNEGELIDISGVRVKLMEAGVTYGLDEDAVEASSREKEFFKSYLIAEGTPSISGDDGEIILHFNLEKTGKPKEQADGKVDFRMLSLFEPVEEGQHIVTRVLPTPGIPGRSVLDEEIPPKPGKDAPMPPCKNALLNEERTEMYAQTSGMVEFVSGKVIVTDVYTVTGDCDMSTGNIDFDGSVKVTGSVISGMKIKASGGISIGGVVEGAELVAEGSIELKRGMQGMDKGRLIAGGSISAMFLERCKVMSANDIHADAIIHSTVEAGNDIFVSGKRGCIIGGVTKCTGKIVAKAIGSVSHSQTDVELGVLPSTRARMAELEAENEKIWEEIEKLDLIEIQLEKLGATMDPENMRRIMISSTENRRVANDRLDANEAELDSLRREMENAVNGVVHVTGTAYPGTKITIASGTYKINDNITYATFKYKEGEVVFYACEFDGKR